MRPVFWHDGSLWPLLCPHFAGSTSNPREFHSKKLLRAKKGDEEIFSREKISVIKCELL